MRTVIFEAAYKAPLNVVWEILTTAEKCGQWAQAFSDNTHFEGEWLEGEFIRILDPNLGGSKVEIIELEQYHNIFLKHVAMIDVEGVEQVSGERAEKWIGSTEYYQLTEQANVTMLSVEITTHEYFEAYFHRWWSKALKNIKVICEKEEAAL